MICSSCGREIDDRAVICPGCGVPTANYSRYSQNAQPQQQAQPYSYGYQQTQMQYSNGNGAYNQLESSSLATAAFVCAFLVPILGLILGIIGNVNYKNELLKKRCVTAIVISVVAWIVSAMIIGGVFFLIDYL